MFLKKKKKSRMDYVIRFMYLLTVIFFSLIGLHYSGGLAYIDYKYISYKHLEIQEININDDDLTQMILTGSFKLKDDKIEIWGYRDMQNRYFKFPDREVGTEVEMDIVNCAGYLTSVKAVTTRYELVTRTGWDLNIIPNSVASDILEKLIKCGGEPEKDVYSSRIYAVASRSNLQKIISTPRQSKKYLFTTLPYRVQWWVVCSKSEMRNPAYTLEDSIEDWADLNGNGIVDTISVSASCGDSCVSEYTCTRTFRWSFWGWNEIGYDRPA